MYNIIEKKKRKTERMLRIEYNVIQNYAEKMAARSKKRFRFDNVLLLGLEGSNVFWLFRFDYKCNIKIKLV